MSKESNRTNLRALEACNGTAVIYQRLKAVVNSKWAAEPFGRTGSGVVKTGDIDYVIDVENTYKRVARGLDDYAKEYLLVFLTGIGERIDVKYPIKPEEYKTIVRRAKLAFGKELLSCELFPYSLYKEPVDVR